MTAADDVRREYVERHRAGQHSWQPGPLVKVYDKPDDIILVCACGEVTRRSIPARALLDAAPSEPPDEYMCPNCVTPWKCNGPHIPAALPAEVGE